MKISIAMSTYNGEKFIREQLDSIVNQSVLPNEIVISDDCSSDNTLEIIKEYSDKFKNIIWKISRNEVNLGWRKNFKTVINKTSGEYVFLADQDDIWVKDKIKTMIKCFENNSNILLLCSNYVLWNYDTNEKKYKKEDLEIKKVKQSGKNFYHLSYPGCVQCFRKEIINDFNRYWTENSSHDQLLWAIALYEKRAYTINFNGILWRRSAQAETYHNFKKISYENFDNKYNCYKNYDLYDKFPKDNKYINNIIKMNKIMVKLYEEKSFSSFIKSLRYVNYHNKPRMGLSNIFALTKYNRKRH